MTDSLYQRIEGSARFQNLVHKWQRFAAFSTLIMLVVYIGFILLIAFAPAWLGTPLYTGTSVTHGIPIGIGIIVLSFLLTGLYVWRANGEFDGLTSELLREVEA